jgi:hypothetical protein
VNDKAVSSIHWSFWVIGAVALIWNVMGVINYFMQLNADALATYPAAERAIVEGRPAWATGAFAIAVFGGTLGGLLLLLRKSAAFYVFIASLMGVIVTHIHTFRVANSTVDFGPAVISAILSSLVVAVFLIWYSKLAERKAWIS